MKDKKKKITVIIISILIVLILLLALTYAYFSTQLSGKDQIVKVGELELVLDETSEGISLDNAVGISDSKGMSLDGSTFELINNGSNAVDYTIYLDDNTVGETDVRIDDKYLKYNLNKNGTNSGATLLTKIGSNPNRVLDSGTIEGKTTNKYKLNLWITDEVDGNYSGQVFSGKLRVEVSQERENVSETLLANIPDENLYDDGEDTFITGTEPNNYIWYSGKLWRAVSINNESKTVKLVTQWNIGTVNYNASNQINFEGSYMEMWLNDKTADGFLGNLRNPEAFIKMDSKWNASMITDNSKPPSEEDGGTIVEVAVGLLNYYEYQTSYRGTSPSTGYLNNGLYWWTLTPYTATSLRSVYSNGSVSHNSPLNIYGVRPSLNLKPEIKVVSGSGTETNPYRLMGDNDSNLEGMKLNTRYSGEYIKFGTGENNLYRIVSHETDDLTKIVSAEPLKENGTFKGISFGNNVYYSSTNTIGSFLNGEYLTSGNYLTSEQVNMIEDSTVWYLGMVENGTLYKLSKYTDANGTSLTSSTTVAKVGLLRYGELMSGQFERYALKGGSTGSGLTASYWTLTPSSTTKLRIIINSGDSNSSSLTNIYGVRPSLNLKSNVIITSGDGTKNNPFEIKLNN